MKTSGPSHRKVPIITFLMCVIQVNGATLTITESTQYAIVSASTSLTCHISSFIAGAEWIKSGSSLTQCQSSLCIPPNSARYQYSADATTMTVTIASSDIAQDEGTWTCAYNTGVDTRDYYLTVYKPPTNLSISGPTSSTVYDDVTVHLSVNTGCIHPSGSAHYNITWKYVEAVSAAENTFGTISAQNFTSVGGCANAYEDNLMFNLYLTNKMNTGNTALNISQIKMIFTMAGRNISALLNVVYNVTLNGTTSPRTTQTTPTAANGNTLDALCKPDGPLFIILYICIIISYIIMVILIIDLIFWNKNLTFPAFEPFVKRGRQYLRILYLVLLITVAICEIIIIIIIIIGRQCEKILIVGLCLGLFIITVSCIFLVVFIKTGHIENRTRNMGPPAIHIGTQNKVESKRPQPLPPVGGVVENKPRPQPTHPENIDAKDRNQRGLPANYDDTQGLPTGTPRPNRLTPLTTKQATVQEEDAPEEPKKKKKKKKKKGQMNEENQEEEMEELRNQRTLSEDK